MVTGTRNSPSKTVENVANTRDSNQTWQTLPLIEAGSSPALLSLCAPGTMKKVSGKGYPVGRRVSVQPKEEVTFLKGKKALTREQLISKRF